jgi:MFS family permease
VSDIWAITVHVMRILLNDHPVLSPLASSMFTPGIEEIAADLGTSSEVVVGATTGFVVFLGLGPLILAPLSETFGRRKLYLICFSIFALLQIPTALSPNVESLIAVRAISGFFGSTLRFIHLRHVCMPDQTLTMQSRRWYRKRRRDHQ